MDIDCGLMPFVQLLVIQLLLSSDADIKTENKMSTLDGLGHNIKQFYQVGKSMEVSLCLSVCLPVCLFV